MTAPRPLPDRPLVAVVGPTASGKTELAVQLARLLRGELINADSRQAIAELKVGVCKPTPDQLGDITCHGLDWRGLGRPYSVALFTRRTRVQLQEVWSRGKVPIVVGGTGMYIRALLGGFDFGELPPAAPAGGGAAQRLRDLDPEVAGRVDLRNPRRVERALALAVAGKRPSAAPEPWALIQLGLKISRDQLRCRIADRARRLVGPELAVEVQTLRREGWSDAVLAEAAIGYREALAWLDGDIDKEEAVERITRRTWRYARAQLTWWRAEPHVIWVDGLTEAQRELALRWPQLVAGRT
ncbi:MAG: tRNA (adenosine(37)-N6)-dimethylallyltransferase MiaA [Candidatus Dormiibacterota bacterium]